MNKPFCPMATACIHGGETAPDLRGGVSFYELTISVLVEVSIQGLPNSKTGFFGFHIHNGNSCSGADFSNTGSHYNPKDTRHPTHAGDLPPLLLCNGGANMTFVTDRFRIKDIIGKTVVIHDSPDDFTTQPAGNAGTKIACGVIEKR